jgi:hypothetical protein
MMPQMRVTDTTEVNHKKFFTFVWRIEEGYSQQSMYVIPNRILNSQLPVCLLIHLLRMH